MGNPLRWLKEKLSRKPTAITFAPFEKRGRRGWRCSVCRKELFAHTGVAKVVLGAHARTHVKGAKLTAVRRHG